MEKGTLFVVSAPSGCGKGTILRPILEASDRIYYSVSATTRQPRSEDVDGVTYRFMTKEGFETLISENGFFEYAKYCDNYYGTPKAPVLEHLENGDDVILEIETQGAFNIKKEMPEAVLIFILPPSLKELRRRLEKRGSENSEVIDKRMSEAAREISLAKDYDYVIINDGIEEAIEDFKTVCKIARLKNNTENIINEVLNNA